jgi:hypothetical protein
MTAPAYGEALLRFVLDLAAVAALALGLFRARHGRMDLVVVYVLFNVGLFVALLAIAGGGVSLGVGFGLFAVLSIVRLRSEPYSNHELAYFFAALVLALVTAIDLGSVLFAAVPCAVVLTVAWAIDHPRIAAPARRLDVTLELVFASEDALRRHLEERLDARVVGLTVREIDYVRETTRATVSYTPAERAPEALDARLAAAAR